ncbi:hypothetical protein P7C73_g1944, partial [Tremellales sp. Uapishka_1]
MPFSAQPPSPPLADRPRPTLADVTLPPRRRLRDGRTSRGSSSSSSRGRPPAATRRRRASTEDPEWEESRLKPKLNPKPRQKVVKRTARQRGTDDDSSLTPLPMEENDRGRKRHREEDVSSPLPSIYGSESPKRRYTAMEKGKGKAIVIEDDDEEDEDDEIIYIEPEKKVEVVEIEDSSGAEDRLDKFNCPVCFCEPTRAVLTACGHILCSKCLHASLLAAVQRNPNPYPVPARGRGGARGIGRRGGRGGAATGTRSVAQEPPAAWTKETLTEAYAASLKRDDEYRRVKLGVSVDDWEAIKAVPNGSAVEQVIDVEEVFKGGWIVNRVDQIIEGECPVCSLWSRSQLRMMLIDLALWSPLSS